MIPFVTISVTLIIVACEASEMSSAHQEGVTLAQSLPLPQPGEPSQVPGYAGSDIPQSKMDRHTLDGVHAGSPDVLNNEGGSFLVETQKTRERYVIDPLTDPLIQEANRIISKPEDALEEELVEAGTDGEEDPIETCEESGEDTLESGDEYRTITAPKTTHRLQVRIYSHGWGGGLSRNVITDTKLDSCYYTSGWSAWSDISNALPSHLRNQVVSVSYGPGFSPPWYLSLTSSGVLSAVTSSGGGWFWINYLYVPIDITYRPTDAQITETLTDTCQHLEEKVEKGICSYESIDIVEGPETRQINDYIAKRDWWRRKKIYRCHYPSKNNCSALRAKGCYQVASKCSQKVGDTCVVWEQTYKCPKGKKSVKTYRTKGKGKPFCLSGDCADKSYQANGDFLEVISRLSVLKEAGEDLKNLASIFKGQDRRCSRNCLSFRDCCGSGGGWGVSLKLASCDAEEKELGDLRAKGRCIEVGTYCAEKDPITKICLRKKTTFCCYSSKLARLVQQQGKGQLGLGCGGPENPQCGGLTTEQLAQLDFSKMDFSEVFADMASKGKVPNVAQLGQDLQKSMAHRGSTLKKSEEKISESSIPQKRSRTPESAQGRGNGEF